MIERYWVPKGVEECLGRKLISREEVANIEASVLLLFWGVPPRILIGRKSCGLNSYWACDAVLPGGHIKNMESPVEAALREAWEEAMIHPSVVKVVGIMTPEFTRIGHIGIVPVIGLVDGPACPRPVGGELDRILWESLGFLSRKPDMILHPKRRIIVRGYMLESGALLWGATLRILRRFSELLLECGIRLL